MNGLQQRPCATATPPPRTNEFQAFANMLRRRKWIVIVVTLFGGVNAFAYASLQKNVYQASALMRVETAGSAGHLVQRPDQRVDRAREDVRRRDHERRLHPAGGRDAQDDAVQHRLARLGGRRHRRAADPHQRDRATRRRRRARSPSATRPTPSRRSRRSTSRARRSRSAALQAQSDSLSARIRKLVARQGVSDATDRGAARRPDRRAAQQPHAAGAADRASRSPTADASRPRCSSPRRRPAAARRSRRGSPSTSSSACSSACWPACCWPGCATSSTARSTTSTRSSRARATPCSRPSRSCATRSTPTNGVLANAFDVLRVSAGIVAGNGVGRAQVIAITSAREGEGKSSTVIGLGRSLVRSGRRVLLIDADLRRAGLSHQLEMVGQRGLTEVLRDGSRPRLDDRARLRRPARRAARRRGRLEPADAARLARVRGAARARRDAATTRS